MSPLLKFSQYTTVSKLLTDVRAIALMSLIFAISAILFFCDISQAKEIFCGTELSMLSSGRALNHELASVLHDYAKLIYDFQQEEETSPLRSTLLDHVAKKSLEIEHLLKSLNDPAITALQITEFIRASLKTLSHDDKERENRITEEKEARILEVKSGLGESLGSRALFHRIEPGTFIMESAEKPVEITKPFALMETHATQIIFRKIAEAANKRFPDKYQIPPDPSVFKNDLYLVENISYDDTITWIRAANDLLKVQDPVTKEVFPDLQPHQIIDLPTDAEMEFVYRGAGNNLNGAEYPLGLTEAELKEKAWFQVTAEGQQHKVASKEPFVINGKTFYDLVGLGSTWTKDILVERPPGGKDPLVTTGTTCHVVRGGSSWDGVVWFVRSAFRSPRAPTYKDFRLGFRLVVRTSL